MANDSHKFGNPWNSGSHVKKAVYNFFESYARCLGRYLLAFAHFIYSLVLVLKLNINYYLGRWLPPTVKLNNSKEFSQYEYIHHRVITFRKVPFHMVLIFGPETISYRDVARVIEWCFPAGVRVISFYDCQNGINSNLIFEAICKFSKPNVQNIKWGKSFSQDIKEESKKQINGYIWKPKLVVNVYKREDGLDSLLRIVEELHNSGVKNVDQNTLGELMSKRISAPDPDLAVICGQAMSYFGFLPWHLRITQFLLLDTHHHMTVKKFINLLEAYSNCEQRYGQ